MLDFATPPCRLHAIEKSFLKKGSTDLFISIIIIIELFKCRIFSWTNKRERFHRDFYLNLS